MKPRHAGTTLSQAIPARRFHQMSRPDQHKERSEPTRYRESRKVDPELCRPRETDRWPGRA